MKTCLLTALAVLATSTILAQVPAGHNRPGNVPEGYVITPFGYFHPSCVQSIKEGEMLLANGAIKHVDGSLTGGTTCAYPRFTPKGAPKQTDVPTPGTTPTVSGWVESASITAPTNKSFSVVANTNKVPPNPANDEGQTLFFFPGLEDVNDATTSILQPVLEYNNHAWTMTNWNCCITGVATNSTPITTASGHNIISTTTQNCGANTLSCATWNILSIDAQTRKSTTLAKTPSKGQVFNWAFGGVTEVYGVNTCSDFPATSEVYTTLVFDENFRLTNPKWVTSTNTTDTPNCFYSVKTNGDNITLSYSDVATVTPATVTVSQTTANLCSLIQEPGICTPINAPTTSLIMPTVTVSNLAPGSSVTITTETSAGVLNTTQDVYPGLAAYFYQGSVSPAGAGTVTDADVDAIVTFTQDGSITMYVQDINAVAPATYNFNLLITTTSGGSSVITTVPFVITTS